MHVNVVSLISPKGGTGKSSLATALAAAAASEDPAALYDLDPQGTSHRWWHVHRARSASPPPEIDLVVHRVEPGGVLDRLRADAAGGPPKWVVCDLAGGAFAPLVEVLELSDVVLVPLRPTVPDLATITRLQNFVGTLGNGLADRLSVVLCQVDRRAARRQAFSRTVLQDQAGIACCRTSISQSVVWHDAFEAGLAVHECRGGRFRRAAGELRSLYAEVRELAGRGMEG